MAEVEQLDWCLFMVICVKWNIALSKIWTLVANSVSDGNNGHAKRAFYA